MVQERQLKKENIKIKRYLKNGSIVAYFPLHDYKEKEILSNKWLYYPKSWLSILELKKFVFPWYQPTTDIKEYFGEKITLYFVFYSHLCYWLIVPAIISIPIQVYRWHASINSVKTITNGITGPHIGVLCYAFCVAIWCVFKLEYWKRKCANVALEWGMIGFENAEADRPDYKGKMIEKSVIDGTPRLHFPAYQRTYRQIVTTIAVFFAILLVSCMIASIYVAKFIAFNNNPAMQSVVSAVNAIQIQLCNMSYSWVAGELTRHENYRTETEHEDALILKLFMFQFVNSYASFFFLAFIAKYTPGITFLFFIFFIYYCI